MSCSLGAEVGVAVGNRASSSSADTLEPLSLVVVCAWCGRPIGRGAVSAHRLVSHGICRLCSDHVLFSDTSDLLVRR